MIMTPPPRGASGKTIGYYKFSYKATYFPPYNPFSLGARVRFIAKPIKFPPLGGPDGILIRHSFSCKAIRAISKSMYTFFFKILRR
jgi:hypothetical protein